MSVDAVDKDVEVDLSNLIGVNLTFGPLQLTLQGIIKRLAALEEDNAKKTEQISSLNDAVEKLQAQQDELADKETPDGETACNNENEHDAIWAEIDNLNNMLGELTNQEKDRHTIDELYAARKRRDSQASRQSVSHSANKRSQSSSMMRPASGGVANLGSQHSVLTPPPLRAEEGESPQSVSGGDNGAMNDFESEDATPLGDKVLSKAHERLPGFDETVRYAGDVGDDGDVDAETAETPAAGKSAGNDIGGDTMQPTTGEREEPFSSSADHEVSRRSPTSAPTPYEQRRASRAARVSIRGGSGQPFADADAATAAAAARRQSQAMRSSTVSDRLKKDSDDIAYLNRVVAEILGEMKSLHDNVDYLQTLSGAERGEGSAGASDDDGRRRLRELETRVAQLQEALRSQQDDNGDLREKLDELRKAVKPATRLVDDDVDNVKSLSALQERLRALENAVRAAEKANERLEGKLHSIVDATGGDAVDGVSAAQFGLLRGSVAEMEKQLAELQRNGAGAGGKDYDEDIARLQNAIRRLQEEVSSLESATEQNTRECARLEGTKADKSDVVGTLADLRASIARVEERAGNNDDDDDKENKGEATEHRLNDMQSLLDDALARISHLDDNKADRTALQRLRDDLAVLKRLVELNAQRESAGAGGAKDVNRCGGGAGTGLSEAMLQDIQNQLLAHAESSNKDRETTSADLDNLRELVDLLDRRKADATLVANKAERDYVENALERLMREVEQVLNATNAGLIDTLDKSLNILRDMIDGKANKNDIHRLQQQMAADGSGGGAAADGLTGFKGYRCLGCNRPMETLRPRSTAPKMGTFLNRNPQNFPQDGVTRTIQQQQSLYMGGTAHSEPLPPIEEGPR